MLTRRGFVGCALCAVTGFMATGASAQTPGLKRFMLSQIDGPVEGYVTVTVRIEIEASALVARHTHPGVEATYLIEGASELSVDGQAPRQLQPGDAFQIPANIPHSAKNGPAKSILVGTYIVEKGKPLASPA
ncbi:cupin domain-containing protein [Methylocapsa sp. S129]|uniref:cupin domain-containing protein n=1 Tax=Methylocapsa sp. S129 TaxID=1641869 RepID=UPI00131BE3D3|nr:cupin domain-containing protein [Methylocapsa sp. S129]